MACVTAISIHLFHRMQMRLANKKKVPIRTVLWLGAAAGGSNVEDSRGRSGSGVGNFLHKESKHTSLPCSNAWWPTGALILSAVGAQAASLPNATSRVVYEIRGGTLLGGGSFSAFLVLAYGRYR